MFEPQKCAKKSKKNPDAYDIPQLKEIAKGMGIPVTSKDTKTSLCQKISGVPQKPKTPVTTFDPKKCAKKSKKNPDAYDIPQLKNLAKKLGIPVTSKNTKTSLCQKISEKPKTPVAPKTPISIFDPKKCAKKSKKNPDAYSIADLKAIVEKMGYMSWPKATKTSLCKFLNDLQIQEFSTPKASTPFLTPKVAFRPTSVIKVAVKPRAKAKLALYLKKLRQRRIVTKPYVSEKHREECLGSKPPIEKRVEKRDYKISYKLMVPLGGIIGKTAFMKPPKVTSSVKVERVKKPYSEAIYDFWYEDTEFDTVWMRSLNAYMSGLNKRDTYTLASYTFRGDVYVNNFLRGSLSYARLRSDYTNPLVFDGRIAPMFYQIVEYLQTSSSAPVLPPQYKSWVMSIDPNNWVTTIEESVREFDNYRNIVDHVIPMIKEDGWRDIITVFAADLQKIIMNAPPTRKKMIVYRGIKTGDFFFTGVKNSIYRNNGFVSTSPSAKIAQGFSGKECCMKKITLLPGVHTVFLSGFSAFPKETEFLLPMTVNYYVRNSSEGIQMWKPDAPVCRKDSTLIKTSEIIVI